MEKSSKANLTTEHSAERWNRWKSRPRRIPWIKVKQSLLWRKTIKWCMRTQRRGTIEEMVGEHVSPREGVERKTKSIKEWSQIGRHRREATVGKPTERGCQKWEEWTTWTVNKDLERIREQMRESRGRANHVPLKKQTETIWTFVYNLLNHSWKQRRISQGKST